MNTKSTSLFSEKRSGLYGKLYAGHIRYQYQHLWSAFYSRKPLSPSFLLRHAPISPKVLNTPIDYTHIIFEHKMKDKPRKLQTKSTSPFLPILQMAHYFPYGGIKLSDPRKTFPADPILILPSFQLAWNLSQKQGLTCKSLYRLLSDRNSFNGNIL